MSRNRAQEDNPSEPQKKRQRASQTPTAPVHKDVEGTRPRSPRGIEPGERWLREQNVEHPEDLTQEDWIQHPPFRWEGPTGGKDGKEGRPFEDKYVLECFCKRVQFSISSDPLDVKICHCDMCKKLHGAPMQAAAVFYKTDARLTKGVVGDTAFFSSSLPNPHMTSHATPCPRKIYCAGCGCPLADEGKNMFIAYPSSLHHHKSREAKGPGEEGANKPEEGLGKLPPAFNVRKHLFYGKRAFDMNDGIEKWEGLDGKSRRMADDGSIIDGETVPSQGLYG